MEMATTGRASGRDLRVLLGRLCLRSWPIWLLSGVPPPAGADRFRRTEGIDPRRADPRSLGVEGTG